MGILSLVAKSNFYLLVVSALGFLQTILIVRFFGLSSLGAVLILLTKVNLIALIYELISSEKLIKKSQEKIDLLRKALILFLIISSIFIGVSLLFFLYSLYDGSLIFALLAYFSAQYALNAFSISIGRPHIQYSLDALVLIVRLLSVFVLAMNGKTTLIFLFAAYTLPGLFIYLAAIIFAVLYLNYKSSSQSPVSFRVLVQECLPSFFYILLIFSKRLRESVLGYLGIVEVLTQSSVAYVSLCYKGVNFVLGQMRTVEIAMWNKINYEKFKLSQNNAIVIAFFGFLGSIVFSFIYLKISGVAPLPIFEPVIFSTLAVPVAFNIKRRLSAFHSQNFARSSVANSIAAFLMLSTPMAFFFFGYSPSIGYALGCLFGEMAVALVIRSEKK